MTCASPHPNDPGNEARHPASLLLEIETAPKPILIHCRGGADRAGLVSALSVIEEGAPIEKAWRHLSPRYMHFKWFQGTDAMDKVILEYSRSGGDLLEWVREEYPKFYEQQTGSRP